MLLRHGTGKGRAIVWSPPMATILSTRFADALAAVSMSATASPMSNRFTAMSPRDDLRLGERRDVLGGVVRRQQADDSRTCDGPNRAPGRSLTPVSNGMPTMATSARGTSSIRGSRRERRDAGVARVDEHVDPDRQLGRLAS